jgi:hypothetical protein
MRKRMILGMAAAGLALGISTVGAQELPPPADKQVDFKADIWPIFQSRCVECHKESKKKSGLRLDNKADALKGGTEGAMVIPGNSAESLLIQLVMGTNDNFDKMPPDGDPLTAEQIGLLRAWIDQGANWPDDFATPPADGAPAAEAAPAPEKTSAANGLTPDWKVEATGAEASLASWGVVPDAKGPEGKTVFGLTATNHTDAATNNLLWTEARPFADGSISTQIKAVGGEADQGGGIVWRVQDRNNYYAARYNPAAGNLTVFKVENGAATAIASAEGKVEGEWVKLTVEASGAHFKVTVGDSLSAEGDDATFAGPGGAGFWTRGDAATHFTGTKFQPAQA